MFGFMRRKAEPTPPNDEEVIQSYGQVIDQVEGGIADEKLLPFSKAVIKGALVRWIPKMSGDLRAHMEAGLVLLAQFQPDVGQTRYPGGLSPSLMRAAQAADTHEAAKMISAAGERANSASDDLLTRVAIEEQELLALSKSLR